MSSKSSMLCEDICFAGNEAFKRLRTNITFSFADGKENHIIGVTSSGPADGKSLIAINLAFSLYELGKKVLLMDCDMRRPSVSTKLNISQTPGLSELLVNSGADSNCFIQYRKSENGTFDVMPSGVIPPNPSELLNSPRMEKMLEKLSAMYDYVIIDLPPVGAVSDAQVVSKLTDGMIVVIREKYCSRDVLDDCISQLKMANAKILGFVLNGALESGKKYSSGYYR